MAEVLTKQQQMAVLDRGGKLLVSAAAGSGKTKVLVDRLIGYLLDPVSPANLDEFLIITYTKAAASELRGKIAAKLTQLIADDPQNRHLRRQLQRLYLTKISTVHSFCSDILREYAYNLDIPGDFRVADETECQELQLQVIENLLEQAYENAKSDPDFCALVDTQGLGRDDRQISQILLKVYSSSRCHLNPERWLQRCVDSVDVDGQTDAAQTVWGRYLLEDLKKTLHLHIRALERCVELSACAVAMEKPTEVLQQAITQLKYLQGAQNWDEVIERKNIVYGTLSFSKKVTDLALVDRIKAVRNNAKERIAKKLERFSNPSGQILADLKQTSAATRGLVALTRRFSVEYDRRKRARRILDFGDLEQRMLDLLLGKDRAVPTAAALEIGARYREIMVDEYQDSNSVQDAIFDALTRKNGNCFMVGDVKQSIYQFRLADPEIFLKKYNSYVPAQQARPGEGRKVLLSKNFRSSGGVISAVNDVFSACMSETVGGLDYSDDEKLHEGLEHISINEPEVELHGICVREDTYSEEADFVANRICQLLDGTHMVRKNSTLHPIQPEDIVILLRSPGSVGVDFQYALERRGIRCVTGGSEDLLRTEEISVLRAFLEIISNPMQDIPLLAVLASKVVGFTADELAAIRGIDRDCSVFEALEKSDEIKVKTFLDLLTNLRMRARLSTLTELLQHVFTLTRMDSIYAALPDGSNKTENLQMFCQLAAEYEHSGQKDLSQFLEHLCVMEQNGLIQAGQQQTAGAVTIMSIHKSKGLEFPVVFLCGLSRRFNKEGSQAQVLCHKELGLGLNCVDNKNRVRYPTLAKCAISAKIEAESVSEEMRVLYVAMTRPKDRLIMTYAASNLQATLQDIARRMDMTDSALLTSEVSCPGAWVLQTALRRTEAGAFFAIGDRPECVTYSQPHWLITASEAENTDFSSSTSEQTFNPKLPPEVLQSIRESLAFEYAYQAATKAPSKQTATQLKGRIKDQEAAENTVQMYKHTFRKPSFVQSKRSGREYGNAMHSVMQYINFDVCVSADAVAGEIQRLIAEEYISSEYGRLADAERIAALFRTELGQKLRSGVQLYREFKFSILDEADKYVSGAKDDEILLQGVVDCAIIEPDGITVIDFKTDRVTEQSIEQVTASYATQVQIYADALKRIFMRPIKGAMLYYFSVDRFVNINV